MDKIALLQELIRIPSYSGNEHELAVFLADYCRRKHIPVRISKGNVIIHLKGKDRSKAVIFNAHLDTVNAGEISKWKYPPTGKKAGKLTGGKLYGLGASDDKGAIASMMLTAEGLINPPCDVWFTFVCNEETDGSGTENFLKWFLKKKQFARYKDITAVIGEPTGLATIEIGHRGNVFVKITVCGDSGHSALQYAEKRLAVVKAMKILELIKTEFSKWEKIYAEEILGSPSFNITQIAADSTSINKIPDRCVIRMDIRTTPEFHGPVDKLLKKTIGKLGKITYEREKVPPGLLSANHRIIRYWKNILPDIQLSVSLGSTDQTLFLSCGIPAVVFGPGSKCAMHKENEFIYIADVRKAANLYRKFIYSFAGK